MNKKKVIEFLQMFAFIFGCSLGCFGILVSIVELAAKHPFLGMLVMGAGLSAVAAWIVVKD